MVDYELQHVGGPDDPVPAPFTRAELSNGTRVVVRPNHTLPLVAVSFWLAVGALHETDEHTGVCHFLEHMFFKGTKRYPVGEIDRVVKGMGGYNNAATSMEYTQYHIVAPSEHLPTVLDLLVDHMVDLALPADELDKERQVVVEEIRRREDSPTGKLYTSLSTAVFGASPYAREVLGTPQSLERITTDVMREFWQRHYTAGRLAVTVSGDVDPALVTADIAQRLADFPSGAPPTPAPDPPQVQPTSVREQMDLNQGYLAWAFATPGRDELERLCALEIAATILGDGMTSRLYRRLVEELKLVTSANAWTFGLERVGMLGVSAICAPDRHADVEGELKLVLEDLTSRGVTEEEVRRARVMLLTDFAYDNETNASLSGTLGEFEVLFGSASRYREVLAGIETVDRNSVNEILARYLDPELAVRAWVGPDGA